MLMLKYNHQNQTNIWSCVKLPYLTTSIIPATEWPMAGDCAKEMCSFIDCYQMSVTLLFCENVICVDDE